MPIRLLRSLMVAGFVAVAAPAAPALADALTPEQKAEIETMIHDYLLENPEVVREALVLLEEKRKNAEAEARAQAVSSVHDLLFSSTRQAVVGNPDASITLVEFFDYNCGYCKRAFDDVVSVLENEDVKVVLKELPILGPGSVEAARVAIAVNIAAPDRYFEFHQELLMGNGQADERRAMAIVDDLGLDADKIRATMKDPEVANTIEEVYKLANTLGLTGTPSYVIGDEVVFGAVGLETLTEKIVAMRSCGKTVC
jgi:protein-disulfide isomerase